MSDHESEHEHEKENEIQDLRNPDVVTKYRMAGTIVNAALESLIKECVIGAHIADLCKLGDSLILQETSKIFNKKKDKVEKGIAFPCCISPNEICSHFSPLMAESIQLNQGDIIKIVMGCHIDGYISVVGHTICVGEDIIEGRKADALKAAWTAGEAALRTIKLGNKSTDVTNAIKLSIKEFDCSHVQGFCTSQMKRYVIDGNQRIPNTDSLFERTEEFTFKPDEVYGVDIVVTTGDGKSRESDHKTMVFKRAVETNYYLKTNLSRSFLKEVNQRFPTLPFNVRSMEDERAWRIGVTECMRHELLHPYQVLTEKAGEYVTQIKFTVLLLPSGTKKITGIPFTLENVNSAHEIKDETLVKILSTPVVSKKKKSKNPASAEKSEE